MIKLMLTVCISFLSVNLGFALDYYDIEHNEKYENGKYLTTMYLKDQKIEGKSLEDTVNKEFQIVTNKERVIKLKPKYNKVTKRYEFDEKLNGYERGIIAISTNERVKMVSFPKWKSLEQEDDYRRMEKIVNKFTDEIEKNNDREFKRRYRVNKKTHVVIVNGIGFSSDKEAMWGQGSGFGVLKSRYNGVITGKQPPYDFESQDTLYEFIGIFYKSKLIKYFVNFNSTYNDTLYIQGQVKIGKSNYLIIHERKVDSGNTSAFPYLYHFENEKLGKRIEPIYPVGDVPY